MLACAVADAGLYKISVPKAHLDACWSSKQTVEHVQTYVLRVEAGGEVFLCYKRFSEFAVSRPPALHRSEFMEELLSHEVLIRSC